jgi:hypothetical protein
LSGLSELLGKAGVFKDITGLDANQQNALKTLLSNNDNAKAFADMAKEMAMQEHNTQNSGRIMDSIAAAKQSGDITQEQAGQLTKDHLQQQIDGGMTKKSELSQASQAKTGALTQAAVDAVGQGRTVKAQAPAGDGQVESIDVSDPPPAGVPDSTAGGIQEVLADKGVAGISRAVKGDALVGDSNGDVDLSTAVLTYLDGLANCGQGPCVEVSASYFAQAMKAAGVPLTNVASNAGALQVPVIASANGTPVSARALVILWYSNATDAMWGRLPKACRGAGAPGAQR